MLGRLRGLGLSRGVRCASTLKVVNASAVVTASADGRRVEVLQGHDVLVVDGVVRALGVGLEGAAARVVDAQGGIVTPGFVDPHTHLFPPQDRAGEFSQRPVRSYQEIAAAGGGILSSVRATRAGSEEDLVRTNARFLRSFARQGTTTVEVKSGYGLSLAEEMKMLRALRRLREGLRGVVDVVPTFMGAHAVPAEYKGRTQAYVDVVAKEMVQAVARSGLAEYCDVFCEPGYFEAAHAEQILSAAKAHGLRIRIHADEFVDGGGSALAARLGAHSADHLMAVSPAGIAALAATARGPEPVVPVLLPGTTLFLGKGHSFAPAKALLAAGCPVAAATDFNPGSSVFQSAPLVMQLCMTHGGMSLDQAFLAVTHNAALSLRRHGSVGTLQPGALADMVLWDLKDLAQIPYYGPESRHFIRSVWKRGQEVAGVWTHQDDDSGGWFGAELENKDGRGSINGSVTSNGSTPTTTNKTNTTNTTSTTNTTATTGASRVVESITTWVDVDEEGRISRLPAGVDWDAAPAAWDASLDHAPRRNTRLKAEEKDLAVRNALKYFAPSLHATVRGALERELEEWGHIYAYHLLPPGGVFAVEFDALPGATVEGRAMLHMLLNNLDARVAQFPQELVTYGGNGAVFSNWAQFHATVRLLGRMSAQQTLSMVSGHPQGLFPRPPGGFAPAAVITNGLMVPHYSTPERLDRLYALGVSMYGQMTAGSWMYIGPQGIVHGTTLTLAQAFKIQGAPTNGAPTKEGRVFVTSGLGGMSGAQPKACTINGAVCIVAEVNEKALRKRHAQGWLDEVFTDLPSLFRRAAQAQRRREAVSLGYLGNVVDLWEALATSSPSSSPSSERPVVHVGSDQTSLHNPFNGGYYPAGLSLQESNRLMVEDPPRFQAAVYASLRRHLAAVDKVRRSDGTFFFDYGNAFLLECHRAGAAVPADLMSYVECIMGPEFFDFGFGPYRWVCTSARPEDLALTDALAADVMRDQLAQGDDVIAPQLRANLHWIESAAQNRLVVGSQARILYADLLGRVECAVRMNAAVRDGRLRAPVVIGRDHHDVSGTDSPWRETANVRDGSNLTADMSVQNVVGDAFRGASWVSLHNGGGTGWGQASNGGFGLVLDGSHLAEQRARHMLFFDVANGLTRRARAGNPNALRTIQRLARQFPDFKPFVPAL